MTKTFFNTALILAAGVGTGLAQESGNVETAMCRLLPASGPATRVVTSIRGMFFFESSEMAFDSALVKGAPLTPPMR